MVIGRGKLLGISFLKFNGSLVVVAMVGGSSLLLLLLYATECKHVFICSVKSGRQTCTTSCCQCAPCWRVIHCTETSCSSEPSASAGGLHCLPVHLPAVTTVTCTSSCCHHGYLYSDTTVLHLPAVSTVTCTLSPWLPVYLPSVTMVTCMPACCHYSYLRTCFLSPWLPVHLLVVTMVNCTLSPLLPVHLPPLSPRLPVHLPAVTMVTCTPTCCHRGYLFTCLLSSQHTQLHTQHSLVFISSVDVVKCVYMCVHYFSSS